MLIVVWCLLFVRCLLLVVVCCFVSLFVVGHCLYFLFAFYVIFVFGCYLFVVVLLFVVCCSLFVVVRGLLRFVRRLIFVVWSLSFVISYVCYDTWHVFVVLCWVLLVVCCLSVV